MYVLNATVGGVSEWDTGGAAVLASPIGLLSVQTGGLQLQEPGGAAVTATLRTGSLHLGQVDREKYVHRVYLTVMAPDAEVLVTLRADDENGQKVLGPYEALAISSARPYNRLVRVELEGAQYWEIEVTNKDGGPLDVRDMRIIADATRVLW